MIVVDTNVIGYLFLSGERSDQAEQALRKDHHWAAPLLWRSEFRNVLAGYLNRGMIGLEDALQIVSEADELMDGGEYEVGSGQVLRTVARSGCSAYDCEFVALALDLNVPLVTVDKELLSRFPGICIGLREFVSG